MNTRVATQKENEDDLLLARVALGVERVYAPLYLQKLMKANSAFPPPL